MSNFILAVGLGMLVATQTTGKEASYFIAGYIIVALLIDLTRLLTKD